MQIKTDGQVCVSRTHRSSNLEEDEPSVSEQDEDEAAAST